MDLGLIVFIALLLLGTTAVIVVRARLKLKGALIALGVLVGFALATEAWLRFVPMEVVQRVRNTKGTLEAVEAKRRPSLGNTEVLVGRPGADARDDRRVIIVDQVRPSLDLSWYGNDLRISAEQAAAFQFIPQVHVSTAAGPTTVNVYTSVAHWLTTEGSRTGPLVPSQ